MITTISQEQQLATLSRIQRVHGHIAKLVAEDHEHILLSPFDLISLKDTGIPNGTFAMRELDKNNLESLVLSDPDTWPDIQVTLCLTGYIVIDGYHRWEASKIKQLEGLYATCKTYHSENDVVEAAFRANMLHGLKVSTKTKGDYAYWLHISYPQMLQNDIAKRSGITQAAVSKAIARREKETKKTSQQEELSIEGRQRLIKASCKKFTRDALQFLNSVEDLNDQELTAILKWVIKKNEDRACLARIGQLLSNR